MVIIDVAFLDPQRLAAEMLMGMMMMARTFRLLASIRQQPLVWHTGCVSPAPHLALLVCM